ncbi:hypothetical protein [Longitalea luteola]|uniref:hypothetical protein n=1 Tax=Longitalea luteola TaxID=2812563 RepID=UPI001A95F4B3|nr:hypothetical protein [Longitalea luteola]
MKHVFSVLSVTCVAFLTILISSTGCKKGDTGPKGETGNANVQYSPWLDVSFEAVRNTAGDTLYYETVVPAPKITDSVLAYGDVRIYVNNGTAAQPEIIPLPIGTILIPFISKGEIYMQGGDFSTFTQGGQKYSQFRYVIIAGSTPARRDVNLNDYNAVKAFYNIPD